MTKTNQLTWLSRNARAALATCKDRKAAFEKLAYKFFRSPSAQRLNVTTVRKVLGQSTT